MSYIANTNLSEAGYNRLNNAICSGKVDYNLGWDAKKYFEWLEKEAVRLQKELKVTSERLDKTLLKMVDSW